MNKQEPTMGFASSKEPIMQFKNQKEAEMVLREWQERLFLTDWLIRLHIDIPPHEMKNKGAVGETDFIYEAQQSVIRIVAPDESILGSVMRFCAEKTLIHELLHLKYNVMKNETTYEGCFLNVHQHALLEQMAKSLLMAKYDLPFEWFANKEGGYCG